MRCEYIKQDDLPDVLARAASEGWTHLALIGPNASDAWIEDQDWPEVVHLYRLRERLRDLPPTLPPLTNLTSLNLYNNSIGEAGARAIADHLTKLTSLNLDFNDIGEVGARAIAEHLTNLTSLNLYYNNIGEAGAQAIANRLTNLTSLDLNSNKTGEVGARAIADRLTNLTTLTLADNNIGDTGARAIADRLTKLTSLNLAGNKIGDAGARTIANRLTKLTSLNLAGNKIGDAGARTIANRLTKLTSLNLYNNNLTALPRELLNLTQLAYLGLSDNDGLDLPPELEDSSDAAAILDHIRRLYAETRRPLNEAKLLLVGQGAVGKTSLVNRLVRNKFNPEQNKTEGIGREVWPIPGRTDAEKVRLHVWDFGGQEVMHATHQFFLTKRSVYLVVLDARKGENESNIHYWLKIIETFGGDSPVIVVVNKCDGPNDLNLNETGLKRQYPHIRGVVKTSCDTRRGIDELSKLIATTVHDLPHVFEEWPESYFNLKLALAERAAQENYLEESSFRALCDEHGVPDEGEQNRVLRRFHELGVVLNYGEDDESRYQLVDTNVLDPEWVTGGVYRILNKNEFFQEHGVVRLDELPKVLCDADGYPADRRQFIVGMMRNFDLCFDTTHEGKPAILVPELLRKDEYDLDWNASGTLRFEYRYEVLPEGLIPRFIVLSRKYHTEPPMHWRSGVVLADEGCKILVRGDSDESRVVIAVQPNSSDGPPQPRLALKTARTIFGQIHETIRAEEMVPLPDDPDADPVEYAYLCELEQEEGPEYAWRPPRASRKYTVSELLDGVETPDERRLRRLYVDGGVIYEETGHGRDPCLPGPRPTPPPTPPPATPPEPTAPWWNSLLVPGIAALLAVALTLLLRYAPTSTWTLGFGVGAAVFAVVWIVRLMLNWRTEHWAKFILFGCLALAGGAGVLSSIEADIPLPNDGRIQFAVDGAPIANFALGALVVFGLIQAWLDRRK